MKKKLFTMFIAIVACLCMMACSSGGGTNTDGSGETETTEAEKEEKKSNYLSDDEIETMVMSRAYEELKEKYPYSDIGYWKYEVSNIKRNFKSQNYGGLVTFVYVTIYPCNAYGEYQGNKKYVKAVLHHYDTETNIQSMRIDDKPYTGDEW